MRILFLFVFFIAQTFFAKALAADSEHTDSFNFRKTKIEIGGKQINVEIAENGRQHQRGLMYRTKLEDGDGMLFIFADESPRSFWMKNTFVPLSIAYITAQKKVIDLIDMAPAASEAQAEFPFYNSSGPAMYALEVPQGWFVRNNIKVGDQFSFSDEMGKKKKGKHRTGKSLK